ncbi:MAG TPA: AAA family ATPase [Rhizobiaceae bacterium]|nr:AAA family ATPase [Rhizobiaceae bacterium]
MRTDEFFIITGGPGAGKTTLIKALAKAGHRTMPEAGRAIIAARNKVDAPLTDPRLYAELMLLWEIRSHGAAMKGQGPVFFDRGVPELAGFLPMMGKPSPDHFERAAEIWTYNRSVFVAPPWEGIYVQDNERRQSWEEAVRTFEFCVETYERLGYEPVLLPLASVEERMRFVLERTGS